MKMYRGFGRYRKTLIVVAVLLGILFLHNRRLTATDPENTYPRRIDRAVRLLINPAANALEEQLIGKGIDCENSASLYQKIARATVVIHAGDSIGAGVFIGPRLIATAGHVVDGKNLRVLLPNIEEDNLARPGRPVEVESVHRVRGLDLAFVTLRDIYGTWLAFERDTGSDHNLMIVGHPKGKFYSLQKARINKKRLLKSSNYVFFKDSEIFFGNSGGAIVNCGGRLLGVVSMMADHASSELTQGIGINSKTIEYYAHDVISG
ncbi:MAG: trypsin-like peptidase domain-containing protein [Nitrospinae bacterium]|nr:trypsin-like peptidase domain-containing protein [Nitrospinota bacterium]